MKTGFQKDEKDEKAYRIARLDSRSKTFTSGSSLCSGGRIRSLNIRLASFSMNICILSTILSKDIIILLRTSLYIVSMCH